jgi:hypothetical protein
MPECVGSSADETRLVEDPTGDLLSVCESCLDDGWRAVVEVLN